MDKMADAKKILEAIGMPNRQQSDICCYTLLALSKQGPNVIWEHSQNDWTRIHDILGFIRDFYHTEYAENTRETIRKDALHHFRNAAIVEDNGKATNSPNYRYRLTNEAVDLLCSFGTTEWQPKLDLFLSSHERLVEQYASKKRMTKVPVTINGDVFTLSSGSHNELQKAILEEFAPRFAGHSKCIYIGDSTERDLYKDEDTLKVLGFDVTLHDKMPDVILYDEDKKWLFFVEAVTSVGPMSAKRLIEIKEMTKHVTAGKVYVTAFPNFKTFKKFSESLAWETEVWLADFPDHMIHLNGDRFLGPRE